MFDTLLFFWEEGFLNLVTAVKIDNKCGKKDVRDIHHALCLLQQTARLSLQENTSVINNINIALMMMAQFLVCHASEPSCIISAL